MSLRSEEATASIVDVLIPVRDGWETVRRCLASVYSSSCRVAREIIVIDCASSDSLLLDWLDGEARSGRITLLRSDEGATVNSALALHPERDVVLLESSVEVANNWLDRLLTCSQAQADIGTVTPFSDHAVLCAYPFPGWAGGLPGTQDLSVLDVLVARVNTGQWVELPAAEKYCMLIRRACLEMIGFFDMDRFGRGSGEAKDFSRRARAVGWRHALAADVFVHRAAGVPPDQARLDAVSDAERILSVLYPDFAAEVRDFIYLDPPARLRARIHRARAALGGSGFAAVMDELEVMRQQRACAEADAPLDVPLPVVLHITHDRAGSGHWIRDYCDADLHCRNLVLRGRGSRNAATVELVLFDPSQGGFPLMNWTLVNPVQSTAVEHAEAAGIVKWICAAFEVQAVLVSSLIGQSLDVLRLDIPTVLIEHDLFPLCPATSAVFDKPCEQCDGTQLGRCLRENPHNFFWNLTDVSSWQALRQAFVHCLATYPVRVVMPSEELHARWEALFPELGDLPWTCVPYGLGAAFARGPVLPEPDGEDRPEVPARLRVLIPGRLLPHTGLGLWRKVCDELRAFANVLLLDCGDSGLPFADYAGIEVIAQCDCRDWPEKIAKWRPDCALLLSSQPESFCYVLAEMQALAVPAVAVRTGTSGGRIDSGWNGFLVDPDVDAILDILRALDRARERLVTVSDMLRFNPVRTAFEMVSDVKRLLPDMKGTPTTQNLLTILGKRQRVQEEVLNLKDLLQTYDEEARTRTVNQRRLESMVGALAAQHAAIFHSPSWKASAPVRYIEKLWQRLRNRLVPPPEKPEVVRTRLERRKVPRPESRVPVLLRSRASARYWLRVAIGVPDASVIIAGGGPDQSQRALQNFVALADIVTHRSTRACFVWCGQLDNLRQVDAIALKLLREVGDFFVLDLQLDAEVFAGADVLLLPSETVGQVGLKGMVAGIAHVDLPLASPDAGAGGVMAATVTQLLQYCDNTDKTNALSV